MPPRTSGISAATLVLSDEFGHMIDMPFLTIHLRSRQGQFSVSASDACASLVFARGTAVMLASPYLKRFSKTKASHGHSEGALLAAFQSGASQGLGARSLDVLLARPPLGFALVEVLGH